MILFRKRLLPMMVAMALSGVTAAQAQQAPESPVDMEEIIVEGVRSADLNAREVERGKDIFSSIISQDDAGNFADQNVAESLQRLPGITLQKTEGEGRFVTVRGLGPGFVSVNMNGSELASAGGADTRAFALDALPADLLGSIEVFKSLTPDMDLNSIGGTVNVKTVSAFDRGRDTLKATAQVSYQDYSREASPKFSLNGTNLLADDTIGVGYSLSHEKRTTEVYETLHHETTDMRYVQQYLDGLNPPMDPPDANSPRMLIPWEFQTRQEDAERTRTAGSLDVDFRPDDTNRYYARFSLTEYTDNDIAMREYYRFGQGSADHIAYVDPATNVFGVVNADLQHQFFIQESTVTTTAFAVGGENLFDDWTLDYDFSSSKSELDKPDASRVQFRTRFLPILGKAGSDYILGQVISPAQMEILAGGVDLSSIPSTTSGYGGLNGYQEGLRRQDNMLYDNIFIEDSFREDTIDQISVNLRKDFGMGMVNYIKTGFTMKDRERNRDKDRWSIVPSNFASAACAGDSECFLAANAELGEFSTFRPNNPDFNHDFITRSDAERLLAITTPIARFTDPDRTDLESTKEDYILTEDTAAAYLMADLQLGEKSSLIVGARYEQTDFTSTGFLSIRNDRFEIGNDPTNLDIAIPLQGAEGSYGDFFPSVHYRYEMRDDILVRGSLWTSFTRPSFDQARAFARIDGRVLLCNEDPDPLNTFFGECSDNPGNIGAVSVQDVADHFTLAPQNTLILGNPALVAMTSTNFDASISWYASEDLFLQAAVFYKDIEDFVVRVSGANRALNELPVGLPIDQVTQFTIPGDLELNNVNFAVNGDKAKVYGVELSYTQYFTEGLLNNFFVQSNLTLLDSKANVGDTLRAGEIQLPDQADHTLNVTLGWENEDITLRLIGNYRSKVLERIGSCSSADIQADQVAGFPENCQKWADVFQDDTFGLDFKATYQITDNIKVYFDALNITEEIDIHYFQGNQFSNGNVLFRSEDYGSSFQFGLNYKFM